MGIFDDIIGGIGKIGGGFVDSVLDNPLPLVQSALLAASTLGKDDSNYGTSKEYLEGQTALDREKLAQAMEIAKLNAASGGSGASAAIAVARINAAAQARQLKEKLLADNLANKLTTVRGRPELVQGASDSLVQSLLARGQAAQQGYQNASNFTQGFRAR